MTKILVKEKGIICEKDIVVGMKYCYLGDVKTAKNC